MHKNTYLRLLLLFSVVFPVYGGRPRFPARFPDHSRTQRSGTFSQPRAVSGGRMGHANSTARGEFTIGTDVVSSGNFRYGMNLPSEQFNNYLGDASFEPTVLRWRFYANGDGTDRIPLSPDPEAGYSSASFYDCFGDHFFKDAEVRVYRFESDRVRLIRRDTISDYRLLPTEAYMKLVGPGEPVRKGDHCYVSLEKDNVDLQYLKPERRNILGDFTSWDALVGPGTRERDSSTGAPNGGKSCMRIKADTTQEVEMGQARYGGLQESFYPRLTPGATYQIDIWLKQVGIPGGKVTFRMTGSYGAVNKTWEGVTGEWQKYSYTFTGPAIPRPTEVVFQQFAFSGGGTLWLDAGALYDTSHEPFSVRARELAALKEFKPGTLRIWCCQTNQTMGTSLDNVTNPESTNVCSWNIDQGRNIAPGYHLPTALKLCEETGAIPWIIVGTHFSEAEWLGLIEYLAGPADSFYGRKRAAAGHPAPWTLTFPKMLIEVGNECWNSTYQPWGFFDSKQYGQFCQYFWSIARSSLYFPANNQIEFISGGWTGMTNLEYGYGPVAFQNAPLSSFMDMAGYNGAGPDTGREVESSTSDAGFQSRLLDSVSDVIPDCDDFARARDQLSGVSHPCKTLIYEAGPDYVPNIPEPQNSVQLAYGHSLAAGVDTLDCFLYANKTGFSAVNFHIFQESEIFGTHSPNGFHPYPAYLSLQMRNQLVTGDMVGVVTQSTPTVDIPGYKDSYDNVHPDLPNSPLIAVYPFKDGGKYSVFVISRRLNETTPVTLHLPAAPVGDGILYTLSGDPRKNNDAVYQIKVQQKAVSAPSRDYAFDMPPGSVYLLVFDTGTVPPPTVTPTPTPTPTTTPTPVPPTVLPTPTPVPPTVLPTPTPVPPTVLPPPTVPPTALPPLPPSRPVKPPPIRANRRPVADATRTPTVDGEAFGRITLDGSRSSDPDRDLLGYEWSEGTQIIGRGVRAAVQLRPGRHVVQLRVTDGRLSDTATVVIVAEPTADSMARMNALVVRAKPATRTILRGSLQALANAIQAARSQPTRARYSEVGKCVDAVAINVLLAVISRNLPREDILIWNELLRQVRSCFHSYR